MAPTLLRGSKPPHLRLLKSSLETRLSAKGLRQRGMWGTPAFLPDTSDALRGNVPLGTLRLKRTQSVPLLYPHGAWAPSRNRKDPDAWACTTRPAILALSYSNRCRRPCLSPSPVACCRFPCCCWVPARVRRPAAFRSAK